MVGHCRRTEVKKAILTKIYWSQNGLVLPTLESKTLRALILESMQRNFLKDGKVSLIQFSPRSLHNLLLQSMLRF